MSEGRFAGKRAAPVKRCKDCPEGVDRPAPNPGPRCATHHRTEGKRKALAAHSRRVERVYGLALDGYWTLYEEQGGRCAICRWATGRTKRLAVDHDHRTGRVRGILCGPCNSWIAYIHSDPSAGDRAAAYLRKEEA